MLDRLVNGQGGIKGVFDLFALLFVPFKLVLGGLQAGEAGGAGDGQIAVNLVGEFQVLGAEGEGEQFVNVVGRGGAAAEPVGHFFQADLQGLEQPLGRFIVLFGGGVQGAAGVVGVFEDIFWCHGFLQKSGQ